MTRRERRQVIDAAIAATSAGSWGLGFRLLRESALDVCGMCGRYRVHRERCYLIQVKVQLRFDVPIRAFANTNTNPGLRLIDWGNCPKIIKPPNASVYGWLCNGLCGLGCRACAESFATQTQTEFSASYDYSQGLSPRLDDPI